MPPRDRSASAGLVAVQGKVDSIRVGSLIQGRKGTNNDVWKIVDMRHPAQFDHRTSPWFLAEEVATGERVSIPPRPLGYTCMFMVPEDSVDPDVEKPKYDTTNVGPASPLSDGDAVALLVESLGARVVATQDHETKVWHCPPYEQTFVPRQEYVDHIEVAHGIDLSGINALGPDPDGELIAKLVTIHGESHSKNFRSGLGAAGGFPHVHDYKPDGKPFGELD